MSAPRAGRRRLLLLAGLAVLGAAACGPDGWEGRGEVREVMAAEGQLVIAHEDIPGLMPAMTMSFDVADPALLREVEPGQRVAFRLVRRGKVYEITALEPEPAGVAGTAGVAGSAGVSGGGTRGLAEVRDPAPGFTLVDQQGRPFSLDALRGRAVLLDFIFTRCPGPCPVLTGIHLDVQRGLGAALRDRVHLVSVTLDPAHDSPEVLRRYAGQRGIDTDGWSLLTGDPDAVGSVVADYGVGTLRGPDGNIEHTVATFLIDPQGRIARRYLGLRHEPETILEDLEQVL